MSEFDDLSPEACGVGWHVAENLSDRERRERFDALKAGADLMAAWKRQDRRRERAREIAALKTMQKAGLPVKAATIDGVVVEFDRRETMPPPEVEIETPEQWGRLI